MNRCKRCIMDDSSDETITFDENGFCNYCTDTLSRKDQIYFPNAEGQQHLEILLEQVKASSKGKKYDCIMGLSGGLDSSYLAYLGYKWGLRVLAVHIDDGYDTEISKENLKKLVDKTGFDYQVIQPDAYQFNQLTKAYMKASVPNIAVPQDNILFAFLYECMKKNNIKYFMTGGNFALESILQRGNTHSNRDIVNIRNIYKRYGTAPIDKLKFTSTLKVAMDNKFFGFKTVSPLNYINYNRNQAFAELKDFCGFEYYGRKHLENIFTAFAQLYWFPKKFGVDKRTSHLSSMIVSGQLTREEALKEYAQPLYDEAEMEKYIFIIKKKLEMSDDEFDRIMAAPGRNHEDFKCEENTILFKLAKRVHRLLK